MGEEEVEEDVVLDADEPEFFRLCLGSRTLGRPEKVIEACGKGGQVWQVACTGSDVGSRVWGRGEETDNTRGTNGC